MDAVMVRIFGKDWKTTVNGYLTIALVIGGSTTSYLATIPSPTHWQIEVSGALTTVMGILRILVGHLQQDAGTVEAVLPSGAVEAVPSHEVPDSPVAIPVKGSK